AGDCWGGLDLASTNDLTSFALFWPSVGYLKVWSWCPADNLTRKADIDRVPYPAWRDAGHIIATPGRATNKRTVAVQLGALTAKYKPVSIAADRWGMPELERVLSEEGIELPIKEFGQGYASMSPAVKRTEELILNRQIIHDKNPVLTWAVSN